MLFQGGYIPIGSPHWLIFLPVIDYELLLTAVSEVQSRQSYKSPNANQIHVAHQK